MANQQKWWWLSCGVIKRKIVLRSWENLACENFNQHSGARFFVVANSHSIPLGCSDWLCFGINRSNFFKVPRQNCEREPQSLFSKSHPITKRGFGKRALAFTGPQFCWARAPLVGVRKIHSRVCDGTSCRWYERWQTTPVCQHAHDGHWGRLDCHHHAP